MKPSVDSFKNLLNDLFGVIWLLQPPVDPIVQSDHVRGRGKVFIRGAVIGVVGAQYSGGKHRPADLDGSFTLTASKIDQIPVPGAAACAAQLHTVPEK